MVATAAAVTSVMSGMVLGAASAQADPGCPGLYVVAVPGTWETSDKPDKRPVPGMLSFVTRGLPSSVKTDYVGYAATAFPWEGDVYGKSKKEATDNARGLMKAMAQRCGGTRIALLGYSQGADAAGDLAAEIGTGTSVILPNRLAAVGLLSDPRRSPTDALVGPAVAGAGAGGPRIGGFGLASPQTRTICARGDLYCSAASDDFVTRFAGFLAQISDPNPANFARYQQEAGSILGDLMAGGGFGTLGNQFTDPAIADRQNKLKQFYGSRVHTNYPSYYVAPGQTATGWMHNWLAGLA